MSERTVLAAFYTEEEANRAALQIKALGAETAHVDELHRYEGMSARRRAYSITGQISSLASLSLDTTVSSKDAAILLGADPSASGMTDGQDDITGRNYLLTAVGSESLVDEIVKIIQSCNGYT